MKTIYISGKIDGCELGSTYIKFQNAKNTMYQRFRRKEDGEVRFPILVSPIHINAIPNGTWFDYMMRDLVYLKHCDTIYMLKDWKDSAGARIEHEFAKKLGLEIIYEEGGEDNG